MSPYETWRQRPLIDRIRLLRYLVPPLLAVVVIGYQLGVARWLEDNYGHTAHYGIEIAFYSLTGPVVTWITLAWVERRMAEKDALERKVHARTEQLVSLTDASPDAILSLDREQKILSWNKGASRLFGFQAQDVIGQSLNFLLPETPRLDTEPSDRIGDGTELAARTRSGLPLTVELTQTHLASGDEDSAVRLLIMRDITARREREAILEEERARIARDLHDGVAQTLYFLALQADMARQKVPDQAQPVADTLAEIGRGTRQVIGEVRRTIFALSPPDWVRDGFLPALSRFVQDFAEQVGWQAELTLATDLGTIPARLEPTIFRLIQESLNNVAKHARARSVQVCLARQSDPAQIILEIRDDGEGFNFEDNHDQGYGLRQMEARVQAVGGQLTVDSQPGRGARIEAHLPLSGAVP